MEALKEFIENPSVNILKESNWRKADWVTLAKYYNIECPLVLRKVDVKNKVVRGLVDQSILGEEALNLCSERDSDLLALRKMELKIQGEEKQRAFEMRKIELQMEEREKDRAHELQKLQHKCQNSDVNPDGRFDLTKYIKMVPEFDESDPDEFFSQFEKVAKGMGWPEEGKVMLAQSAFKGKAQTVFNSLSDISKYEEVKHCILKSYERVPESYRLRFRNMKKTDNVTFLEFAYAKERQFTRWLQSSQVTDFEGLKDLMLLEEFKRQVPPAVKLYLEEKDPSDVQKAAILAENFILTHKGGSLASVTRAGGRWCPSHFNGKSSADTGTLKNSSHNVQKLERKDLLTKSNVKCFKCSGFGHVAKDCASRRKTNTEGKDGGVVQCINNTKPESSPNTSNPHKELRVSKGVQECFTPFISRGFVSKAGSKGIEYPVKILRDTAASHSLLLRSSCPQVEDCFTGESTVIDGVGGPIQIPYARVYLDSHYIRGFVIVAVTDRIPCEGIALLLGNDLAGEQVFPNIKVTKFPSVYSPTEQLEKEYPELFPICAVTRRMAKMPRLDTSQDTEPINTSEEWDIARLFDVSDESGVTGSSAVSKVTAESLPVSREDLVKKQSEDPSLARCYEEILSERELDDQQGYYLKEGVLVRKYIPVNMPATEKWAVKHQIVVPVSLRAMVLHMAHDNRGGHLGCSKTSDKILRYFFWPGVRKDIAKYCKSCLVCQKAGKPNEVLKPVPLKPIPVVSEPFSKIIIDCVGPLPKTKKGNSYLFTIMCATTRYPEAIPVKKISARIIVDKLINFFTVYGIPKIVQSDQGSNFTSGLFKEVMKKMGIKQYLATAYHPESQGMLERFHQTFKSMLRKYCLETENEWDDGISLSLFAIRDCKQESLGFSPNELVFGHEVCGPLKMLKDSWLDHSEQVTLSTYMENFTKKLKGIRKFAEENLRQAQLVMKENFDRKSENRTFKVGDKVLLLLPTYKTPLQAKYEGPYDVLKKISNDRYIIKTPGRRKSEREVHVNNMKFLNPRPAVMIAQAHIATEAEDPFRPTSPNLSNSSILSQPDSLFQHLEREKAEDVEALLMRFPSLFGDVPQRCVVASHDVVLLEGAMPVKQAPYRLHPKKRDILREEVQFLLENGLAEPSCSEWASPCLLVPKADGSFRMCTDYRKVNQVTRTDSYPLPRMDDLLDDLGAAQYLTKIDLLKGYYQVSLSEKAKQISAFITPEGLYQYLVMPFGLKNAPGTFQRMINQVIRGLNHVRAYLDDLVIFNESWTEHISDLTELFSRLEAAKLTVNLAKCCFAYATINYLGHEVGRGKVAPLTAKIEAIKAIPPPKNRRELRRFLGMVGYYRRFCPNFAHISSPLTDLISPKEKFEWSSECQESFDKLKSLLTSEPVLKTPDFNKPFQVQVDASGTGVGAVLLQEGDEASSVLHPVSYMSHKFKTHQRAYSTIEKELLALVQALDKWDVYLGQNTPITVYSDHSPLQFLARMRNKNQRLTRWSLFLQKYNIAVKHIKGKENVMADLLSRVI